VHYIVERVHKTDPFGEIIDSSKRAGNEPGRAQAYTLARQLGKRYPDQIIFINKVISRDETQIAAIVNATPEVIAKYPAAEVILNKKLSKAQIAFDDMVSSHMAVNNSTREVALKEVQRILAENTQVVETGS
jgi:hypothetical protein